MNGLEGMDFTASGLRGGRQKASRAIAEDLAAVVRLDWNVSPGVIAGVSGYYGNSGQDAEGLDDIRPRFLTHTWKQGGEDFGSAVSTRWHV